jgi:hypothetical protein
MHSVCPAHLIIYSLILKTGERYEYEAPHYAIFSSLLSFYPSKVHIFSLTPFLKTLPLKPDQVIHPYKTKSKITVSHI